MSSSAAVAGLITLVMVVGGAYAGLFYLTDLLEEPTPPDIETEVTATLIINFTTARGVATNETLLVYEDLTTENATVLGLLFAASNIGGFQVNTSHHSTMGEMITAIDGVDNDEEAQMAWIYYLNFEGGQVSASRQTIQDGDYIEWRYQAY